jgi:hypothetical protein
LGPSGSNQFDEPGHLFVAKDLHVADIDEHRAALGGEPTFGDDERIEQRGVEKTDQP